MNEINPKIATINKIADTELEKKQGRSSQKADGSFDKILTHQIEKELDSAALEKTTRLPEIDASFKAQQLNLSLNQTQFTQKLDHSLNMLETYASWLGDPDKTLKQAYGLLEEILTQTKTLELELKDDASSNTDLKQILTQLMTTAQVEQIKLDRGDYSN